MKIWAKVRLNNQEELAEVIQTFFENFEPNNTIVVENDTAEIIIEFENKPSMPIINILCKCKMIGLKYKGLFKNQKDDESEDEDSTSIKVDDTGLAGISKQCNSYNEFVSAVTKWLDFGKKESCFRNLIEIAGCIEKINWKSIEDQMKKEGNPFTPYDKIYCNKQVVEKFKQIGEHTTILKVIKEIVSYKNYDFNGEEAGSIDDEPKVKFPCMPEIPFFEKMLANIDKSLSVEKKVESIFVSMGIKGLNVIIQKEILSVSNVAVVSDKIDIDRIFSEAGIAENDTVMLRMNFSKFINDFAKIYDSSTKIKLNEFLEDLRDFINS